MLQTINIGLHWEKLFTLQCKNNFFKDGESKDFSFQPTNKTHLLLKKYKLFFKSNKSGFSIFCNIDQFKRIMNSERIAKNKISFIIKNNNNLLLNYTDLSFKDTNKLFYFNNLHKSIYSDMNLLHDHEFLTNSKKIKIFNKIQTLRLDKLDKNTALLDCKQKAVKRELWNSERHGHQNLMLRNLEEGKYSIKNGKLIEDIYVIDYIREPVWGIIDIYLNDLPKEYNFYSNNKIIPQKYHINLSARRTFWKYFIIGDNNEVELKLEDVKITYNGKSIEFTKPVKTILNNGVEAFVVESKKDIELQEVTDITDKLEMKIKSNGKWRSKVTKIPKPSIKRIKPDKVSEKVFSTTYVYV